MSKQMTGNSFKRALPSNFSLTNHTYTNTHTHTHTHTNTHMLFFFIMKRVKAPAIPLSAANQE